MYNYFIVAENGCQNCITDMYLQMLSKHELERKIIIAENFSKTCIVGPFRVAKTKVTNKIVKLVLLIIALK